MFCRNKTSLRDPHHGVRSADFQVVCKFLDELPLLLCSRLILNLLSILSIHLFVH